MSTDACTPRRLHAFDSVADVPVAARRTEAASSGMHGERARAASEQVFEREALPHLRALYRAAYRLTDSVQDAEDLVQETFLRAYRSFDRYAAGTDVRGWLFTILYRARTDAFRRAARRLKTATLAHEPACPGSRRAIDAQEISQALERLPEAFRQAVLLRDVEGFRYDEIARILDVPRGTVMSRIHRGRTLLRAALGPAAGPPTSTVTP